MSNAPNAGMASISILMNIERKLNLGQQTDYPDRSFMVFLSPLEQAIV
jgi:hypothetical protein